MSKQEALLKIANLIKEAKQIAKDNGIDINLVDGLSQQNWDDSGCTIDYEDSWNSSTAGCEF